MPTTGYALMLPTKLSGTDPGGASAGVVPNGDYLQIKAYTGMPALDPERMLVRITNRDDIDHFVSFGFGALVNTTYLGVTYKTFSGDRPLAGSASDRGKLAGAPYVVIVGAGSTTWFGPFQSARVLDHYHAAIGVTLGEAQSTDTTTITVFQLPATAHPKPNLLAADFNADFND